MNKMGPVQKKIIIALLGGVALGMSSSPRQYFKTLGKIRKSWSKANQHSIHRSIKRLSTEKLIKEKKMPDGSLRLILTEKGKNQAKMLSFMESSMNFKKPRKWDGKWRIVVFDIPEKDRAFRDILRSHLHELEFFKLQNSVFVSPYPFEKIIIRLTKIYSADQFVKVMTAEKIDNDEFLKKKFFKT